MENQIKKRISSFQKYLKERNMKAFIIPSTDPHLSEYVAEHWKAREWLSGFTGSAGTLIVTSEKAGLWTDSRYFIQAEEELKGTDILLFKEGLPDTPTPTEWLCSILKERDVIGIDGKMFSIQEFDKLYSLFQSKGLEINTHHDPMRELWTGRPSLPPQAPFIYPLKYAGKNTAEKIKQIREELNKNKTEAILLSTLDEIAWVLNIRGEDVKYNPVVISYLLITLKECFFFLAPEKRTPQLDNYLEEQNIQIMDYAEIFNFLSNYKGISLQLTPEKTNYQLYTSIPPECQIAQKPSPVALPKAIRNEQEIKGIHAAMIRDGVALVRFLYWMENSVSTGQETEMSVDRKLFEFRSEQDFFHGESFGTIAGYKDHAAIIHYSATPETDSKLCSEGFLLLDSGAQYLDGTTDITRTIALGPLSEEEKRDYTLVLKGHIDLAMARFPAGTRGTQLDILARLPIWKQGMNYLHGTGHGVGHFLNVHEGPQSIRMNENPITLEPGMIISNEPGVYIAGSHGIRIENLLLVCKEKEGMYGEYYNFETITLCPIDKKPIIRTLLTNEEIEWLNTYHQIVFQKLSPYLNNEEQVWLKENTSAI